jgi:hypothetical protein
MTSTAPDRHRRHAGHLGHRAADRLPGQLRHRPVPDRNLPGRLRRPLGTAVELLAGIPSIIYGMWGLFVFAPLFGDYVQPFLKSTLGQLPLIGQFFSGPPWASAS